MNRPLTKQQQAVYDFIRDRIIARGYGPTVREIGEHMNIKSPNGVMCHLRALERKGMLTRTANKSRAIELTEPVSRLMGGSLPISGRVVGGLCTRLPDSKQVFDLGQLVAAERYVVEVRDDSLLDSHIMQGDGLIIQKTEVASIPGQLVLVAMNDAMNDAMTNKEHSLRYWWPESGRVRLGPVNRTQASITLENANVVGVVVGVVRLFNSD